MGPGSPGVPSSLPVRARSWEIAGDASGSRGSRLISLGPISPSHWGYVLSRIHQHSKPHSIDPSAAPESSVVVGWLSSGTADVRTVSARPRATCVERRRKAARTRKYRRLPRKQAIRSRAEEIPLPPSRPPGPPDGPPVGSSGIRRSGSRRACNPGLTRGHATGGSR
jgi:hypothetical protein